MDDREATPEQRRALFRVVRGEPSDAEVAALTVVLAAAGGDPGAMPRSAWGDPAAVVRGPLAVGPGAWAAAYRPR
ncbi:MAG: acyl-CoA carboxylase epsilon subunit [Pseudonocardia sp.]